MRVVVAGGSGFLGIPLRRRLAAAGHQVTQLVRGAAGKPDQVRWDPGRAVILPEDTAAVINLGGATIGHRWTPAYKREIVNSRVRPTLTLAEAVARQGIPVLINASGVGFYGDTGDRVTDESHGPGDDFLARLSIDWEGATRPASEAGARVVLLRTGFPLDKDGGFLKPQLLFFRLGLAGKLGSGRQWVPWISMDDWLRAAEFVLREERVAGPVNMVGPEPVTNAEFTRILASTLHRPALIPVPRFGVRVLFGKYAEEGFRSLRIVPKVLLDNGFDFNQPRFGPALEASLR